MKPDIIFNAGTLPYHSSSKIAVNLPSEQIIFYDYNLKELFTLHGYQILELSNGAALLRINRDITFFDIVNREKILDLKNTRIFPFALDGKVLFNYRKSPTLELRDFLTAKIIWRNELSINNRVIQGVCNTSFFIGNILGSAEKICIDISTGELKWKCNLNSLLNLDNKYAGNNYLVSNTLVSLASYKDYFGVEAATGEPLWHLDLYQNKKMGKLLIDNNMFLIIRDANDVYMIKIDLKMGEIVSKELLTEQIQRLQIYPRGNTGTFGQLSYYNNQIFFGANNQLVRLDLSTNKIKVLYKHDATFYFSKVIGSKLFYSDDSFTTLVFELNKKDQEA